MSTLYKHPAQKIYNDIAQNNSVYETEIEGIRVLINQHVYPSEKFRTTSFVLNQMRTKFQGKSVCDMGCGPGIVGLFAFLNGAKHIVCADINPYAVENAKDNIKLNKYEASQFEVFESDCFDAFPHRIFDVIVWNMPFHNDDIDITDPLMRAFYDPKFTSIRKFLSQIPQFSHNETDIYIAFSTKGDVEQLQQLFSNYGFKWNLWRVTNSEQEYDNRLYHLTLRTSV